MATLHLFLYTLLISTIFGNRIVRPSRKYMKSKVSQYATPIGVCYSRNIGGRVRSMILRCEEQCDYDTKKCQRNVMAYRYKNELCSGDAFSADKFKPRMIDYIPTKTSKYSQNRNESI